MRLAHIQEGVPSPLAGHAHGSACKHPTGHDDFDELIGGGLPLGAVVLLAGEPGAGKSTLALQIALASASDVFPVLYHCGEQAPSEVASFVERLAPGWLAAHPQWVQVSTGSELPESIEGYGLVIVDSIQCMSSPEHRALPGSITQLRLATEMIVGQAKSEMVSVLLIGHFTKAGGVSGPRAMEHAVDCVMTLRSEGGYRVLKVGKNRLGPSDGVGLFDMTAQGLERSDDRRASSPEKYRLPSRTKRMLIAFYPAWAAAPFISGEPVTLDGWIFIMAIPLTIHWMCLRFAKATQGSQEQAKRIAKTVAMRRMMY